MHKEKNYTNCKKYTIRSVNEAYSKLLCQFSNTNGIAGKNGRCGVIGNKGIPGNKGNKGIPGNKGYQGNYGSCGDIGLYGDTGNIGNDGNKGNIGNIGKGNTGSTGNMGSYGNLGSEGLLGETGNLGNNGNSELNGDSGEISLGNKGEIGENITGAKGDFIFGETGNKGDIGKVSIIKGSLGDVGDFGNVGVKGNQEKGNQGDKGNQGIIGDPTSPINVYAFANNTSSSIIVYPSVPAYYPDNNLSSGINITQTSVFIPNPITFIYYTTFSKSTIGETYLIIYDLKVDATITPDTFFSVVDIPSSNNFAGSTIQAPSGYVSNKFISFNRVCIVQPNFGGDSGFGVFGFLTNISLLNGINGAQILIIQIA